MRTTGKATDLITFSRSSGGTALRKIAYGDELVTNGTFDTDSDWQKEASWTISGGTATYDGAIHVESLSQNISLTTGKLIKISYTVKNVEAGKTAYFNVKGSSGAEPTYKNYTNHTEGDYEIITTVEEGTVGLVFIALNSGTGGAFDLDNVSIKEVLFDQGDLTLFNHPADIPRIEYDADGNVLGLLVEEARTNLLTYSEDFSNAAWTKQNLTVTPNAAVALDGRVTADKLVESASTITHRVLRSFTATAVDYTFSIFVKAKERSDFAVRYDNGTPITSCFDLNTITVTATGSDHTSSIVDVGNGWRKITITRTFTAGNAYVAPAISDGTVSTVDTPSYTGDGTSGIYIWGAQLEAGSFPTSYIPTSGSTATRAADVASIPISEFGYNQSEGTLFADVTAVKSTSRFVVGVGYDTQNYMALLYQSGNNTYIQPGPANIGAVNYSAEDPLKAAASFDSASSASSINGAIATDVGSSPVGSNGTLYVGSAPFAPSSIATCHIKSIKYIPRRLTNDQLQEITS